MIDNKTKSTLAVTVSVIALLTYSSSAYAVSFSTFADFDVNDMHNTHTRLPLELKSTPSNSYKLASVCSLGTGNCSSESDLNSITSKENMNKSQKCIDDGYTVTSVNCKATSGFYPIDMCPYHSQYFKTCADCTAYTFSQCPDNSVCSQCYNKKYKVSSCKNVYELVDGNCQCPESVSIESGEKCSQSCEGNCIETTCKPSVAMIYPNDTCTQYCSQNTSICTAKTCNRSPDAAIDCVNGVADESDGCGGIRKVCKPDTPEAKCKRDGYNISTSTACQRYESYVTCPEYPSLKKCIPNCASRLKEKYGNKISVDTESNSSADTIVVTQNISAIYPKDNIKIRSYLDYTDIEECRNNNSGNRPLVSTYNLPSNTYKNVDIDGVDFTVTRNGNYLSGRIANSTITFVNHTAKNIIPGDKALKLAGKVTINGLGTMRVERASVGHMGLAVADGANVYIDGNIGHADCVYTDNLDDYYYSHGSIAIGSNVNFYITGQISMYGNKEQMAVGIFVGDGSLLRVGSGLIIRETNVDLYASSTIKANICLMTSSKSNGTQVAEIFLYSYGKVISGESDCSSTCFSNSNPYYVTNRSHLANRSGLWVSFCGCSHNASTSTNRTEHTNTQNHVSPDGVP